MALMSHVLQQTHQHASIASLGHQTVLDTLDPNSEMAHDWIRQNSTGLLTFRHN